MATWTFSGYKNGRGAEITFTYTASFNPATNQTTVAITNCTSVFNTGGSSSVCELTGTLTAKAADNTASSGSVNVSQSKNGNNITISTDVGQTLTVTHAKGTSKQIVLSFSGDINAAYYHIYPEESTTVSVYTASAYTLTLNNGAGTRMEVYLYYSPFRSKSGMFTSGDTIYTGEVIRVWAVVLTGYENLVINVSNVGNLNNADIFTVTGNHVIKTSATLKSYTLTINADIHAAVTVTRGGEALSNGAEINHFDQLSVTASAVSGYKVSAADINGTVISPDTAVSHTVSGPVTVTVFTEALSNLFIDTINGRKRVMVVIDSGGQRKKYRSIFV